MPLLTEERLDGADGPILIWTLDREARLNALPDLGDGDEVVRGPQQLHGARVVAGDLEEVGEQIVEALGLRVEQFGAAGGDGVEVVAGVVDEVGGGADRRERGRAPRRPRRRPLARRARGRQRALPRPGSRR